MNKKVATRDSSTAVGGNCVSDIGSNNWPLATAILVSTMAPAASKAHKNAARPKPSTMPTKASLANRPIHCAVDRASTGSAGCSARLSSASAMKIALRTSGGTNCGEKIGNNANAAAMRVEASASSTAPLASVPSGPSRSCMTTFLSASTTPETQSSPAA